MNDKLNSTLRLVSVLPLLFAFSLVFLGACANNGSNSTAETQNEAQENQSKDGEFVAIFDGQSLDGWEGDPDYWKVEDGHIIGYNTAENPLKNNTFLIWRNDEPSDFELKLDFKISESGNSGVQYRSEELQDPQYALKGYQADIDGKNTYTGQNYEERGRGFLAKRGEIALLENDEEPNITGTLGDPDELKTKINHEDWNTLHIIARGNHIQHYVNDILMSEVTDDDTELRAMKGKLGLQVHQGPPMEVRVRNILYKDLSGR